MKRKSVFTFLLALISTAVWAQTTPKIALKYSRLFATYEFVKKLSGNYPETIYKEIFNKSKYHTAAYQQLIAQLDALNLYYEFSYPGYPVAQKLSVGTTSIIQRNLIYSTSLNEFKKNTFGLIPAGDLFQFAGILEKFEPVYDSLVYLPNKDKFDRKFEALEAFVHKVPLGQYFQNGIILYNAPWDYSIPIDIAVIPSIDEDGFTGTAFFNNIITEVPLNFNDNDALFSVLMHEIYHTLYNEQSLAFKNELNGYFYSNASPNSQYANLLLNEALATAMGNGYVFEQINGKPDPEPWYNVKYIAEMSRRMYPLVKQYLAAKKPMDKQFVDEYIRLYDQNFSAWTTEPAHLFTYRNVLTGDENDFKFLRKQYRRANYYENETGVTPAALQRQSQSAVTKVVIISANNKQQLKWVQETYPELKTWKYNPAQEFMYTVLLKDRTKLFVVNKLKSTTEAIFTKNLPATK
ncbi:hypothetical protein [Taibaiella chishuiensis]|uniref:DUF4932 domain-containing protein n=1 Tax=Taibaiella chishuiensis TaxID=1434707 RepID=A0A2P8DAX2_9BACT|nr:hypothetical protein [Taibaiella chishuiensis]PSK94374.1 hypothetical protein B0I18_101529 [Taibaiella chishuiensis]